MTKDGDVPAIKARLNYPIRETAILLGLSVSSTQRRIRTGRLRAVQDGGRVVVPREAIDEYRNNLPQVTA